MPSNMELKVDTSVGPNQAQAKMLLTWIGEYRPDLITWAVEQFSPYESETTPTPVEQVASGEIEGVQLPIPDGEDYQEAVTAANELADLGATVTVGDDSEEE